MSYRDDREALRQQLDALRSEVEELRAASGDDKVVTERINTLTTEVSGALERMDEDREVLQKLATSLRTLKKTIAPEEAEPDKPEKKEEKPAATDTVASSQNE